MLRLTIQHRPTNSGAQYLSLLQTTSTQPMNLPAHFQPPTKISLRLNYHRATATATAALPQHQHATINARSRAFVATQPTAYTLLNEKSKKVKNQKSIAAAPCHYFQSFAAAALINSTAHERSTIQLSKPINRRRTIRARASPSIAACRLHHHLPSLLTAAQQSGIWRLLWVVLCGTVRWLHAVTVRCTGGYGVE